MSTDNSTILQYRLVNCIASGQSSQVWEAIDNETTRRVAMKLLLPEALKDPDAIASLKGEYKIASSFDHPNIVKYHQLLVKKQHAFFTMDLFPSANLKNQLSSDLRGIHMRIKRLVEQVCLALEHIHERGWVHRDIKPDNILMNKSSEVRVIDFSLACRAAGGLSKMLHRKQATVQGTRTYMAPEQIMSQPLTPQTDIYNLGVTLFELLTGQPPFKGSTPKDLLLRHLGEAPPAASLFNPNVTPEMDMVIQKMLSKKPEKRHKKMAEFMAEFRNIPTFKEEVTEAVVLSEKEKAEKELKLVLGERLDSRSDAMRKQFGVDMPVPVKKKKAPVVSPAAVSPQAPAVSPGARPATVAQAPPMPQQPMYPMPPMMPMHGMPVGQMPMAPYPMMPGPQGPVPWVMPTGPVPAPGMPAGPWVQRPPTMMPPQPAPFPPAAVMAPSAVAPAAIPRPAPPPPTAVPVVAPQPQVRAPQPPPPKTPPAKAPPKPPLPGEGFNIGDLAAFDDLPPVS